VMRHTFAPKVLDGSSDSQLGPELLEVVQAIRGRCRTEAEAVDALPDAMVDELAAAGTPDQVTSTIDRVYAAGADTVVLIPFVGPLDPDLRRYAEVLRA
jgi:alkanesulfonate monooxygenase SsuD/methylene tetrahydromethanopterin reductase-like flavin-dependent oxidoreductase (luciferase family)